MRGFQKKEKLKYIMQSKLFLMFLAIVIVVFIFNIVSLVNKMEETSKNKKIVVNRITELEKSKKELDSNIIKLQTKKGIEEDIRKKFGLAKEGENMIMIIDDKNLSKTKKKTSSSGFFSFFENLFK